MSSNNKPTLPFVHKAVVTEKGIIHTWDFFKGAPVRKKWKQGGKPHGRKTNKNN